MSLLSVVSAGKAVSVSGVEVLGLKLQHLVPIPDMKAFNATKLKMIDSDGVIMDDREYLLTNI